MSLDVNKLVDNVVTTDEERKELKLKFKQMVLDAQASAEEQITRGGKVIIKQDGYLLTLDH